MRRARPKQHQRRLKRKTITVNKGIKKRKRKRNYSFMFKSFDWKGIEKESKERAKLTDDIIKDPYYSSIDIVPGRIKPYDTLRYLDFEKVFTELESKGVKFAPGQKSNIRKHASTEDYEKAYYALPREAKISANLAINAPKIRRLQKEK